MKAQKQHHSKQEGQDAIGLPSAPVHKGLFTLPNNPSLAQPTRDAPIIVKPILAARTMAACCAMGEGVNFRDMVCLTPQHATKLFGLDQGMTGRALRCKSIPKKAVGERDRELTFDRRESEKLKV